MRIPGANSLRFRVILPTALMVLAAGLSMGYAALQLYVQDLGAERQRRVGVIAETVERGVRELMRDRNPKAIGRLLGAMAHHRTDLDSVSLLKLDGEAAFSSDPVNVGQRAWSAETLRTSSHTIHPYRANGNGGAAVLRPIHGGPRCYGCHDRKQRVLGYLDVRLSDKRLTEAQWRLAGRLAQSGVPALLLLIAGAWWLISREAVRPIRRLVGAMKRAEDGDLGARADEGRADEIGVAARCFNDAMTALQASRTELEAFYRDGMERADRFATLGEVATGLAHEIKNPLAGLSGAMEILAEELSATPEYAELTSEMQHQVDRLSHTMSSLLDYARPAKVRLRATDVNAALSNVLFLIHQQTRTRRPDQASVELVTVLSPRIPLALADPAQIEQVFLNLCLNAVQAMNGSGGMLTVLSRAERAAVVIEISDSGPGIPPEVGASLFKPFFTTRPEGTGLGLATSQRIISDHGGQIAWSSRAGEGTTFSVTLRSAPVTGEAAP